MPTLIKNAQIRKNTIANDRLVNDSVSIANQTVALGGSITASTLAGALKRNEIGNPDASVAMNSQKITGLLDPTESQDAATKNYVDGKIDGLSWKNEARVASQSDIAGSFTSNGVFTLTAAGALVLDGVSKYELNDSILLKSQTNNIENGIYELTTLGEGRHFSATFKLDTDTANLRVQDFANKEITITLTDGSSPVSEVFIFENTTGEGARATGAEEGGKITVQMNGKTSAEQIMRELEQAIGAADSVIKDLAQLRIVSFTAPDGNNASSCVIVVESLSSAHTSASAIQYGSGGTAFDAAAWRNADDDGAAPTTFGDNPVAAVLTRRSDANTGDLLDSAAIFVKEGDVSADAGYVVVSDDLNGATLADLDTRAIAISQFNGLGQVVASDGIEKTGNALKLKLKKLQAEIKDDDMVIGSSNLAHAGDVASATITVSNNGSIATGSGSETEVRLQPANSATAVVFKANNGATAEALEFEKGGSDTATATNLAAKINAHASFTAYSNGNVITVKHAVVHADSNSRTITFANNGDPAAFTVSTGEFENAVQAGSENFDCLVFGTHLHEIGSTVASNPGSCTSVAHVEVYQNGVYLAGKVSSSAPSASDLSDVKFNRMDCYVQIDASNGALSKVIFAQNALDIDDFIQLIHAV